LNNFQPPTSNPEAFSGYVGSWELEIGVLRSSDAERLRRNRRPVGGDRVVAAMAVHLARGTLFLDVSQLAAGRELAIPADHTSASKCPETQEPHQTHGSILHGVRVQSVCLLSCRCARPAATKEIARIANKYSAARRTPRQLGTLKGVLSRDFDVPKSRRSKNPNPKIQFPNTRQPVMHRELASRIWDSGFASAGRETIQVPRRVAAPPLRGREQF